MNLINFKNEAVHMDGWKADNMRKTIIKPTPLPAKATYANRKKFKKYWKFITTKRSDSATILTIMM